jgi:Rap1a immunity proteins
VEEEQTMKPTRIALAATLALGAASAQAATEADFRLETTAQLGALCAAQPGEAMYGPAIAMCHGFLAAAHAVHAGMVQAEVAPIYCVKPDAGVTRATAARDFAAWVAATPAAATQPAIDGLFAWARVAYPCPK